MCDGVSEIIAGVGAAASLVGTGVSYMASSNSAAAAASAQEQELTSQNTAFQSRLSAQTAQTSEQAGIEDQSQAAYLAAEQKMRSEQSQALTDKSTALQQMNTAEQAVTDQTTKAVQDTTQAITPASLQQAQAASEAARNAAVQPTVQDIAATNPLPSGGGEHAATTSALAKSMSDAADYTQKYGANLARLGAYSAPTQTANLAASNLATQLLPAAEADKLLKAGVSARLLPSETAYSGAGTIGEAAIAANTANTSEQMSLASTRATYAEDLANQQQSDTNALIQTGLNVTQARDAATSSIGSAISSIGNAAVGYGASKGAFSDLFGAGTASKAISSASDLSPTSIQSALKLGGDQYVP